MRRRRGIPREPTALSDGEYQRARHNIDKLEERYISFMCPVNFKSQDVIEWLFPENITDICREAYRLCETVTTSGSIKGVKFAPDAEVSPPGLNIDPAARLEYPRRVTFYMKLRGMALPKSDFVQDITQTPLAAWCVDTNRVTLKFQQVRMVFEFFQKNGTPGSIRNYWPSIMPLLPDGSPVKASEGYRCKEPTGMGERLTDIRDSTEFLNGVHLLPDNITLNHADQIKAMFTDAPYYLSGSNYFGVA